MENSFELDLKIESRKKEATLLITKVNNARKCGNEEDRNRLEKELKDIKSEIKKLQGIKMKNRISKMFNKISDNLDNSKHD